MSSFTIASISAACIFAGAMLGILLQQRLPGHHLSKEMQDLVKLSAGTVATLTALVLGLLVSSAKTSFDGVNAAMVQGGAKYIVLDRTLARYGPEATPVRALLKKVLADGIESVWPSQHGAEKALTVVEKRGGVELLMDGLDALSPRNDSQRQLLAQARQLTNELGLTRWLLVEQAKTELPVPLLVILVFWLFLLFVSFGLFAPKDWTAVIVLFIGACAISGAIFLVLELNEPLDGFIKVSNAPLRNALHHLGEMH